MMPFYVGYVRIIHYTDGCFTEFLLSNLVGDVCSHEDGHGDTQFPSNDLWDQLQTLKTCINTLRRQKKPQNLEEEEI